MRLSAVGLAVVVVFAGSIAPAEAHNVPINTGNGLLAHCTTDGPDQVEIEYHLGQCLGFIKGVGNTWALEHPKAVCVRDGADNAQLRDIVVGYLRRVVQLRDQASAYHVIAAMTEAFPCGALK